MGEDEGGKRAKPLSGPPWLRRLKVAGYAGVFLLALYGCGTMFIGSGSSSAASECRSLASDLYGGGHGQHTEITHTNGDFIKGRVVQIRDGSEYPHHHWECSYESGEPVITFQSPAAG